MDLPINGMVIRIAEEADAEKLLEIYAPYVEKRLSLLNIRFPPWKNSGKESGKP